MFRHSYALESFWLSIRYINNEFVAFFKTFGDILPSPCIKTSTLSADFKVQYPQLPLPLLAAGSSCFSLFGNGSVFLGICNRDSLQGLPQLLLSRVAIKTKASFLNRLDINEHSKRNIKPWFTAPSTLRQYSATLTSITIYPLSFPCLFLSSTTTLMGCTDYK